MLDKISFHKHFKADLKRVVYSEVYGRKIEIIVLNYGSI